MVPRKERFDQYDEILFTRGPLRISVDIPSSHIDLSFLQCSPISHGERLFLLALDTAGEVDQHPPEKP